MLPLYIGIVIIFVALGYISWIMWQEKKQEEASSPKEVEAVPTASSPKKSVTTSELLGRLGLPKEAAPAADSTAVEKPKKSKSSLGFLNFLNKPKKDKPAGEPKPEAAPAALPRIKKPFLPPIKLSFNFSEILQKFGKKKAPEETGTVSLRLDPGGPQTPNVSPNPSLLVTPEANKEISTEAALALEKDELQSKHNELSEKHEMLDKLLQEKNIDLEKSEKALTNELKNRKEFHKLKDILEKELKDNKDKCRDLQIAVTSAQTEAQSYLKRVNQLEEKVTKVEKEVLKKEDEIKGYEVKLLAEKSRIAELEKALEAEKKLLDEKGKKINELVKHMEETAHGQGDSTPETITIQTPEQAATIEPLAKPEPAPEPLSTPPSSPFPELKPEGGEDDSSPIISPTVEPEAISETEAPKTDSPPPTSGPEAPPTPESASSSPENKILAEIIKDITIPNPPIISESEIQIPLPPESNTTLPSQDNQPPETQPEEPPSSDNPEQKNT